MTRGHGHRTAGGPHLGSFSLRGMRVPLFVVLFGAVLAVTLAPFGTFALLTIREMREALVTTEYERQLEMAGTMARSLDEFVQREGRQAIRLAEAIAQTTGPGQARPRFLDSLLDETVLMVTFTPVRGEPQRAAAPELVVSDEIERTLERTARTLFDAGPVPRPASARQPIVDGPFAIGPARVIAIGITAPVQRRGRLLGAYQELVLIERAWNDATRSAPVSSAVFLVTPDRRLVSLRGAGRAETPEQLLDRPIVTQFLEAPGPTRASQEYAVRHAGGGERRYLGAFASTSFRWGVFVETDQALAFAPIRALMRRIAWGGTIAAGLALAVTMILGGSIARPITRLADVSKRLAQGDFTVVSRPSRVRELDELATSFNRMAEKLGALVERFRAAAREANALFLGTIRALAEAIDEKDPYTKGHSVRVNRYAVIIGRYLGLSREELRDLHVSSLLHDVGKIGIDDAILKKPAALTPVEFEVMKSHPTRGAKIMGRIPQMKNIIPGMRFHHERWAGGGYPSGLKGDEIPMQARIIAVADTFDAMTTDRPYQRAFDIADAVARINDLKGIGFDPAVVEAFNRAYEAGELEEVLAERPRIHVVESVEDGEGGESGQGPARSVGA
ncbi:MAG: hypothetical protein Kow0062_23330 [Acidobacteriota bacterium]